MIKLNEVSTYREQLPDTLEDLSKFVLVSEERIQALRAEIRAIKKVHLAKEVYEQKLAEAQEIGQITVEAAQKMGELLLQIQTAQGKRTDLTSVTNDTEVKTKTQITQEMGMSHKQVLDYQQMAQNPEAVQAAIAKAIENGDVVSRNQVMKEIRAIKAEIAEKDRRIAELQNREPEVREVVKEVVKEVVPNDYEEWKSGYQKMVKERQKAVDEMLEAKRELREIRNASPEQEVVNNAKEQMDYFSIATYNYLKKYGGFTWAFNKWEDVPEETKKNFVDAINALAGFSQQMLKNLEVINERTEQSVND